jgi:hypothetical protein
MKLSTIKRLTLILCGIACATPWSLNAEFIQPVDVWVSNGTDTKGKIIDGLGLDSPGIGVPGSTHSTDSAEMWSSVGSIKAEVVCDLGKSVDLTKVYVWNYNVAGSTDVGMKDVEVAVSPDTNMTNANFTTVAVISLLQGGTTGQVFNVTGTDVRLVRLRSVSNWGQGYTVGLAEVRFESGAVVGKVPSVVITGPHEGDVIDFTNTIITLKATVTDKDNNLAKVEFFDGNMKLGEKQAGPYSLDITAPAVGDHALRVTATDNSGYVAWSTVSVIVREFVADRIIQIDDAADEGTGSNQISYTGGWTLAPGVDTDPRFQHNDHYDSTKNDYFEVHFTGVKIDIYATVASHHGTGTATIDGGTAYTVNYKMAQRAEQVHVWSSPLLPQREHVLRVTVVGDGVVTADRFDVSVSDKPVDRAVIKNITSAFTNLVVELEDVGQSIINKDTVKLFLNTSQQTATVSKAGSLTTISSQLATPLLPGSTNIVRVTATEISGTSITNEAPLIMPKPYFPQSGLGAPASIAGKWGFRQIWNAGRADAVVTAADIALQASQPGFAGKIQDTNVSVINFSLGGATAGFMPDVQPFPAETAGLATEDFVVVARAQVVVPSKGDWTIGVHSDEGFALRFIGAPFDSISGTGDLDSVFPEYIEFPTPTADSDTRAVLKNLAAGKYGIEFIYFQRTGAAFVQVYAAPGAIQNDADSADWQLIGAPGGWQIAAGVTSPITIRQLAKTGDQVTIDFDTPAVNSAHQLLESSDLKNWQVVSGASFVKSGANAIRATLNGAAGNARFYRVSLP